MGDGEGDLRWVTGADILWVVVHGIDQEGAGTSMTTETFNYMNVHGETLTATQTAVGMDNRVVSKRFDNSIGGLVIEVTPYRTEDIRGYVVEVDTFYVNGGTVTAEGCRVKKNGEVYRKGQVAMVRIPTWVIRALDIAD